MKREMLANKTAVYCTKEYRFGQDALMLAHFSRVKTKEAAADFGTGCGIIALRWHDRGHRGPCVAVERQQQALKLLYHALSENQEAAAHITPLCADVRSLSGGQIVPQSLDVIACNPPYFKQGVQSPVRARAVARHQLFCTIGDVCRAAWPLLKDGGRLCLCQRPEHLTEVLCELNAARIEPKRLQMVHSRFEKEPWLVLVEGMKNRSPGLRVLAPLVTQRADLTPSDEMLAIYGQTRRSE